MDFADTPEEAAFRAEARAFLDANLPAKRGERGYRDRTHDAEHARASQAWQATKAAAGFAGIQWPKEYGGRGGSQMESIIYAQEEARYDAPYYLFNQSVEMALPTIMKWGRPDQIEKHARPALYGEDIWCQLFSEPSAGSDLAGLRTRATQDGDQWVVNGQKIWTSNAHFARFGMLIARTDSNLPKHEGLTAFILDMASPGIVVRRIRQISGNSNFCEVFLSDVRIADSDRLAEVGQGWKVSLTMLANERFAVGQAEGPDVDDLIALTRILEIGGKPALDDPEVRSRVVDWWIKAQGVKFTRLRTQTALSRGRTPGPEATIGKLVSATAAQQIASFGIELLGLAGAVIDPAIAPMNAWFQQAYLYSPGKRISGGTDEILRNIIGERVLGLPPEPRVDKNVPFHLVPTSGR